MKNELSRISDSVGELVLGKSGAVKLSLAAFLARGHLLIEDLPGVGKTLLAHALAKALGLGFSRVQFTNDLLPSDILGVTVFDAKTSQFTFHQGPVFSQVLLADEINRASPKTQSALLEAMEERQVTIEGVTRPLPAPFFVVATQNPLEQAGTFPLPESQLDRFLMRITLGYPDAEAERRLWREPDRRELLEGIKPAVDLETIRALQKSADEVFISDPVLGYVQRLVEHTRNSGEFKVGLSPRGGHALIRAARAWALLSGRDYLTPDDVQAVAPAVAGHRLVPAGESRRNADVGKLLREVPLGPKD